MHESYSSFFVIRIFVFICFVGYAVAQMSVAPLSTATFSYPPSETSSSEERLTINVKDLLQIEWASNYDEAYLYLFCHGMKDGEMYASEWLRKQVSTSGSFMYSPETASSDEGDEDIRTRNWMMPASCHFDIYYWENPAEDGINKGVKGPSVNITSDGAKPATIFNQKFTSSVGSATDTVQALATSTTATSSSISSTGPTTTRSSSPVAVERTGGEALSPGAVAGISIGTVSGIVAIAGIAFLLYRRYRKKKTTPETTMPPVEIGEGRQPPIMSPMPVSYKRMHPSELETRMGIQELPAGR